MLRASQGRPRYAGRVGVVELPGLVHPLVQGVDDGVGGLGVVTQALLDPARQRGEQQRPLDALLVHELEASDGLAERVE